MTPEILPVCPHEKQFYTTSPEGEWFCLACSYDSACVSLGRAVTQIDSLKEKLRQTHAIVDGIDWRALFYKLENEFNGLKAENEQLKTELKVKSRVAWLQYNGKYEDAAEVEKHFAATGEYVEPRQYGTLKA